jgi:hypothetical protein
LSKSDAPHRIARRGQLASFFIAENGANVRRSLKRRNALKTVIQGQTICSQTALDGSRMDSDFGASISKLNTNTAFGATKAAQSGLVGVIARFIWLVLSMRICGNHFKRTQ